MTPPPEIAEMLHRAMGFDAAALSESAVGRAVRKRMSQCGQRDPSSYLVYLRASPLELAQLVEELVVPETWFFRDGKPFEALQRFVMEEWLAANPERPLRLLSVPCSSGEEPYSAVMALLDAGLPPERISVDGVDISNVALAKARRAVYGRNSFRGAYPGLQERYFTATPHGWLLHEAVRKRVNFSQGNLLGDDFSLLRGAYDVIFCRNLLIYFDDQNRERALSVLERLLLPRGVLFVGHAESAPVLEKWFVSVASPHAFAYCKKSALPAQGKAQPSRARGEGRREMPRQPEKPAARLRPPVAVVSKEPPAGNALEQAQRLADQGRLAEAAVQCEAFLREQGASAQAYYLLGLVHDAGADAENAREFFGKAVYLEPNHYEALVQLALLAERQGEVRTAAQLRQRAQRAQQRRGNK
ncbi:MAG: hypothetical protein PHX38_05440 [Sulfuricella sp.]|nr:hypothetical protein [Sulfuricella sp.]